MSIESDIMTALSGVSGGRVFPAGEVPENTPLPLVVYRAAKRAPVLTLGGETESVNSVFIFECWGAKVDGVSSAKANALSVAADVRAAIDASSIPDKVKTEVSGENFDAEVLELMEPVQYSFWHDE